MIPHPFRTLALSTALAVVFSGGAMAQTAPNTLVTNSIDLSYNSGGTTPTVTLEDAASVEFLVDRKIDLGVIAQASEGIVTTVPGEVAVALSFLVENRGNDTQGFVIAIDDGGTIGGASGLAYSATVSTEPGEYYVLISSDGTIANGTIYDVGPAGNAGNLAPGGDYYVLIVANVPISAIDGQFDDFVVTATATLEDTATVVTQDRTQGLMGVNTVFADAASNSTRTADEINAALNGADSDETRLQITAPVLVATKTALVLSENLPGSTFNCATGGTATGAPLAAIPGACVEYTITVINNSDSATAATNIEINDVIPQFTSYAGVTQGGFSPVDYTEGTNTVTATLATLAAGATAEFRIRVLVD